MIIRSGELPSALNAQNKQQPSDTASNINSANNIKKEDSAISSAANTISNTNEIDNSKKVENIKKQIDNGTYNIDINKTADKMAQDLLLES